MHIADIAMHFARGYTAVIDQPLENVLSLSWRERRQPSGTFSWSWQNGTSLQEAHHTSATNDWLSPNSDNDRTYTARRPKRRDSATDPVSFPLIPRRDAVNAGARLLRQASWGAHTLLSCTPLCSAIARAA